MFLQKQSYYDKASHAVSDAWADMDDVTAARALGVVSLAIGLTEILFPRKLQKTMGIHNGQNTGVMRVLGVREICHGMDILSHRDPTPGVWARVAGDVLDGVMLGAAGAKSKRLGGFAAIAAAVLPVVVADMVFATRLSTQPKKSALRRWVGL
jgi:hypothetical protein